MFQTVVYLADAVNKLANALRDSIEINSVIPTLIRTNIAVKAKSDYHTMANALSHLREICSFT